MLIVSGCKKDLTDNSDLFQDVVEFSDGVSNLTITSFLQDKYGYVWIGTVSGLSRYNGFEFRSYLNNENPNSLCNNLITGLLAADDGKIWIGTSNGVCYYSEEDNFKQIEIEGQTTYVSELFETHGGDIVARIGDYLEVFNDESETFSKIFQLENDEKYLDFTIDNQLIIWSIFHNGLMYYDIENNFQSDVIPVENQISDFFMNSNGDLWLVCDDEIQIFNTVSKEFITDNVPDIKAFGETGIKSIFQYTNNHVLIYNNSLELSLYDNLSGNIISQDDTNFPFYVPDIVISTIFSDKDQNLWIGSYNNGFKVIDDNHHQFKSDALVSSILTNKSVISIQEDPDNNIWFLTKNDGIYLRSKDSEAIHVPVIGIEDVGAIKILFVDSKGNVYITHSSGIYKCKYENGALNPQIKYSFSENYFVSFTEDVSGRIWVSILGEQIFLLDENSSDYGTLEIGPEGSNIYASDMISLASGEIAAATFINGISIIDPNELSVKNYPISELDAGSYLYFLPSVIYEDSSNTIWLGSQGDGLFLFDQEIKKYRKANVPCNYVKAIVEDTKNCLWFSTDKGLIKYDRSTDKFISYLELEGIGVNEYNKKSAYITNDDLIVFGSVDGIIVFNPADASSNKKVDLLFEDLFVNNKLQYAYKDPSIDKNLNVAQTINIANDDNYFSISYLALDYSEFSTIQYNYILEGFEEEWVDARINRQAFYSNLSPGKYTFKVRALNNDYTSVLGENSIEVVVHPDFWNHPIMLYLVYPLLIIGIIGISLWQYLKILHSRHQVAQAVMEKEHEHKLNTMNMSFFSNVSHEFRTPLTMIKGPVELLMDNHNLGKEDKNLLIIVRRNIDRMMRFVSQLMDISKIDSDNMRLNVRKSDIVSVTNNLIEAFKLLANEKRITIQTKGLDNTWIVWLDEDKYEKVMSNLVSNALKFTETGGKINVSYELISRENASHIFSLNENDIAKEYVKVVVSDSGKGVPNDQLEKIFERYYQVEQNSTGHYNWGTGIGLYYSKNLVELHHGYIKAENVKSGTGVELTFILPVDEFVYSNDQHSVGEAKSTTDFVTENELPETDDVPVSNESKSTVLIVEDDIEVAYFLKTLFSASYNVEIRFDANSALEFVDKSNSDLIISDVVMPGGMDGYEFCEKIKNNVSTCHIPVILLTAKGNVEHQVEGLNYGADAYVVKPFSPSYLTALVKSQFANRERLRKVLSNTTETESIEKDVLSYQDRQFMDKFYELMEQELSNSELNINKMADYLSISRSKLYYKIKSITGETPNAFFKSYKLNRAVQLIESGDYNITGAAYATGFATLSHFSVSFKKQFGISPSEYFSDQSS